LILHLGVGLSLHKICLIIYKIIYDIFFLY